MALGQLLLQGQSGHVLKKALFHQCNCDCTSAFSLRSLVTVFLLHNDSEWFSFADNCLYLHVNKGIHIQTR